MGSGVSGNRDTGPNRGRVINIKGERNVQNLKKTTMAVGEEIYL